MILVDANLLVYAHDTAAPDHAAARAWWERVVNAPDRVGVPWASLLAFVRLVSNPAVMRSPVGPAAAWARADEWLQRENLWIPVPGPDHRRHLAPLLSEPWMTSRLVPDAHLAALAVEHGLTLCSSDGDFGRFAGLRWENPLAPAP